MKPVILIYGKYKFSNRLVNKFTKAGVSKFLIRFYIFMYACV